MGDPKEEELLRTWRQPVPQKMLGERAGRQPDQSSFMKDSDEVQSELTMEQLLVFLLRDVEKTKHYRRLPFYFLFLAILTTLAAITGMGESSAWFNETTDHNLAIREMLSQKKLDSVKNAADLWDWLVDAVTAVWTSSGRDRDTICASMTTDMCKRTPTCMWDAVGQACSRSNPGDENRALSFLLLRQWRVSSEKCDRNAPGAKAIAPTIREQLPDTCTPRYSSGAASTSPFGDRGQFLSDRDRSIPSIGGTVETRIHSFETDEQFSWRLNLSHTLSEAQQNLTELMSNGWISPRTRLVSLNVMFFNPDTTRFVAVTCYVEFFHTGRVLPGYTSRPFSMMSVDTDRDRFILVMDALHLVVCIPVLLISLVRTVRDNLTWLKIPGRPAIGLWEIFEVFHIVSHGVTCYYRALMWMRSLKMQRSDFYGQGDYNGDDEGKMFDYLQSFSSDWSTAWSWFAISIVLSYLRMFKYLQYNQRLCVLSETLRTAAGDLAGMCLIFSVVLVAFAIGGTMLYAGELKEFMSFGFACTYLLQVLFAGEVVGGLWDEMLLIHPHGTPVYVLSYFVLSWVVLLNMVIAALSNAFIMVVQQQAYHRRSSTARGNHISLWDVILKGLRRGYQRVFVSGGIKDPTEFLMFRTGGLRQRYTMILENLRRLAESKLIHAGHDEGEDLSAHYREVYITWGEVFSSLETMLSPHELEILCGRVHKMVACDKNSSMMYMSQRYCAHLAARVTETLTLCRNIMEASTNADALSLTAPRREDVLNPLSKSGSVLLHRQEINPVPSDRNRRVSFHNDKTADSTQPQSGFVTLRSRTPPPYSHEREQDKKDDDIRAAPESRKWFTVRATPSTRTSWFTPTRSRSQTPPSQSSPVAWFTQQPADPTSPEAPLLWNQQSDVEEMEMVEMAL